MKKIIALLAVVSFMTVNTTGAFAQPKVNNRFTTNRIESRQDKKTVVNRSNKTVVERVTVTKSTNNSGSSFQKSKSSTNNYNKSLNRVGNKHNPYYGHRPQKNHSSNKGSLSPLEFIGVGALIIAVAAAVNN